MKKTIVVAIRHGAHGEDGKPKNALTEPARIQAIETGLKLAEMGFVLDKAISSPQGRALETLLCFMQGMGKVVPITTEERLNDLGADPVFGKEAVDNLKTKAKNAGKDVEEHFATSPNFREACIRRGKEGADAILEAVRQNPGKVIGFASHGGSRMEITQATLQGRNPQEPEFFFERGGVALYHFEGDRLVKVDYLGNLGK